MEMEAILGEMGMNRAMMGKGPVMRVSMTVMVLVRVLVMMLVGMLVGMLVMVAAIGQLRPRMIWLVLFRTPANLGDVAPVAHLLVQTQLAGYVPFFRQLVLPFQLHVLSNRTFGQMAQLARLDSLRKMQPRRVLPFENTVAR
jgi:hypothetical protein